MGNDKVGLLRTDPLLNQVIAKSGGIATSDPGPLEYAVKGTTDKCAAQAQEIEKWKGTVREMGKIIGRGFAYSMIADQKEICEEILNRPEVKALMEEGK